MLTLNDRSEIRATFAQFAIDSIGLHSGTVARASGRRAI